MPPPPVSLEAFLRHAQSLRGLARALLADEHAAEDVVQDTWMTAAARPPAERSRLGGWLRVAAHSLALRHARGEGRRRVREERAAREERLAPTADAVERKETLRSLTEAVLALEEPYSTAILLRFYEDLPPREIAERQGVPVATVDSRIQRGLEKLRQRLDRDHGGERAQWALALAVTTGWKDAWPGALPAAAAPATGAVAGAGASGGAFAGAIAMEWKLTLAVCTAGVLTWSAVGFSDGQTEDPVEPAVAAQRDGDVVPLAPEVVPQQAGAPAEPDSRTALVAGPQAPSDALASFHAPVAAPYEFVLEGTVVGELDLPSAGAEVYLGPLLHPLNQAEATDEHGRFRVSWRGHAPRVEVALLVKQSGAGFSGPHLLELRAGVPHQQRFALGDWKLPLPPPPEQVEEPAEPASPEPVRTREERVILEEGLLVQLARSKSTIRGLRYTERQRRSNPWPGSVLSDAPSLTPDGSGSSLFRWPGKQEFDPQLAEAEVAFDPGMLLLIDNVQKLEDRRRSLAARHSLEVAEYNLLRARVQLPAPSEVPSDRFVLRGTVRGPDGSPSRRAIVTAIQDGERFRASADDDGAYEIFGMVPELPIVAHAGGGNFGRDSIALPASSDRELRWDAVLDRGSELAGRLLDADGEPVKNWIVEVESGPGALTWHDATVTDGHGRFVVPNLPSATFRLVARPASQDTTLAAAIQTSVQPGGGELEWRLPDSAFETAGLSVAFRTPEGERLQGVEVRLWQCSTGRGTWARRKAEDGPYVASDLPADRYRVTAGHDRRGWVDLGEVWLAGGSVRDLGEVTLGEPAILRMLPFGAEDFASEGRSWSLLRRGVVDSLVSTGGLDSPWAGKFAPGEHELVLRGDDFVARAFPLDLPAGAVGHQVVDLAASRASTVEMRWPEEQADPGPIRVEIQDPSSGAVVFQSLATPVVPGHARTDVVLHAGEWLVVASTEGGLVGERTVTVGAGFEPSVLVALR